MTSPPCSSNITAKMNERHWWFTETNGTRSFHSILILFQVLDRYRDWYWYLKLVWIETDTDTDTRKMYRDWYHLHAYMHQPRQPNEQAVLWNQIDKHKMFSSLTLFSNIKSDERPYALGTRHVTIIRHFKKGRKKVIAYKNLWVFLHNQKKFTVGQCCFS